MTAALLIPLALISGNDDHSNSKEFRLSDFKPAASSLIRRLVWLSIGLSLYLTLPLRALTNPPVNWGNPVTLQRLWWLVFGELYRDYYLQFQFGEIWERVQAWAGLLLQQFGWLGLVLGVLGLIVFFTPSRLYLSSIWIALIYSLFALVYSSGDSYVYLIPVYIVFAIWVGLGFGHLMERVANTSLYTVWGIGFLLILFFAFRVHSHAGRVDASKDLRAEMFGRQIMSEVPNDALVFVRGDRAVFTAWYFHFALHERPDLVVIAEELLHFDWYQETLRDIYPALDIPGPFPWAQNVVDANPIRPACYVQYTYQAMIECGEPVE